MKHELREDELRRLIYGCRYIPIVYSTGSRWTARACSERWQEDLAAEGGNRIEALEALWSRVQTACKLRAAQSAPR